MTTIKVLKKDGKIIEVEAVGHSGYDVAGEDIVCAGVSSIIQTAILGLVGVVKINPQITRNKSENDNENLMIIKLPQNLSAQKMSEAQIVLETMLCGLSDLYVGFSDFIELEVKEL